MKYNFAVLLFLVISFCTKTDYNTCKSILYTINDFCTCEKEFQQNANSSLTEDYPLNKSPGDSTQSDSTKYSIRINGQSNIVKITGKTMKTNSDTMNKKGSIRVSGEENTVLVNQTDRKSEVIVLQKGSNNKINITQKK
jgi:hypothetical protein